jgi:adenylate cyclase
VHSSEDLEAALLGAPVELTRDEVSALAGVPEPEARAFWVAMGFAEVPPGERAFTRLDADALREVIALRDSGVVDEGTLLVLARAMGQGLSRLAEGQVQVLQAGAAGLSVEEAADVVVGTAGDVLPRLEQLLLHVWRRQLTAATQRSFASFGSPDAQLLAVGFVDLVGFTRTSRDVDAAALERLLERFERDTSLRVTAQGGRVVKTLGDAVLYVCDDVRAAVEVALATVAAHADDDELPDVRAGVACGPLLQRLGDVFGEPVNLASRLTEEARPGTVLVDVQVAEALADLPSYALQRLHRRPVRGYRALQPYRVRTAG